MANTILEKLREKYPDATGINDARNIAEAVGAINGTGGRGANTIADQVKALTNDKPEEHRFVTNLVTSTG